jgi:hypothetical protein
MVAHAYAVGARHKVLTSLLYWHLNPLGGPIWPTNTYGSHATSLLVEILLKSIKVPVNSAFENSPRDVWILDRPAD